MNIEQLHKEHDSQNEVYLTAKAELFSKGNGEANHKKWLKIAHKRIDTLIEQLAKITPETIAAASSYIESTDCLVSFFDDIILECVMFTDRRKEVEGKILDLVKEALGTPTAERTRDHETEHVVCTLVDALVLQEVKLSARGATMVTALMHDTNPLRLGFTYYKTFCEKHTRSVDRPALEYLQTEENARTRLMNGELSEAVDEVTKLFSSPYNNPEKFLLLALSSFGSGIVDDAKRTLEIGLNNFPGNDRLQSALDLLTSSLGN